MAAKIVVDTSVLIKWIKTRDEDLVAEAKILLDTIEKTPPEVAVPALLLYEVGNILLMKTRLDAEALARAIDQISAFPLVVAYPHADLLRRTARIGRERRSTTRASSPWPKSWTATPSRPTAGSTRVPGVYPG